MTKLTNKEIEKVKEELIKESKKRKPDYSKINIAIALEKNKNKTKKELINDN
tara:strand:- start:112 stop:267 length:156 start_codon:yes stop_codon:yes gene_type:complete